MDIRARSFLSLVRDIEDANDAIIAGGAARDEFLGVKPKDFDIFLPVTGYVNVLSFLINSSSHQTPTILSNRDYAINNIMLAEVAELDYEGIKVQLMGMKSNKTEDEFSLDVINSFDYNLCKIWYDGSVILRDTPEFQSDISTRQMTLSNLKNIYELPKALERFNRINKHLGGVFSFNCPNLQIIKSVENNIKKDYKKYYTTSNTISGVDWRQPVPAPRWNAEIEAQFIERPRLVDNFVNPVDAEVVDNTIRPDQVQRVLTPAIQARANLGQIGGPLNTAMRPARVNLDEDTLAFDVNF